MKVLLCHNYYREPGGESLAFEDEARLLEARGVEVVRYTLHNEMIDRIGGLAAARRSIWNREAYAEVSEIIARERPALMHCTNVFPLISPSVHAAARAHGVPVIQSLHNYRLLCPNALFFRDGAPCEDCLGRTVPWPGVLHACYRSSRGASAAVAAMMTIHRSTRAWRNVDLFVTPSEFTKRKFVEGGLPAERLVVKPNFVATDSGPGDGSGRYGVFVGRFSPEKGLGTLLEAWSLLSEDVHLKLVGDGPMAEGVRDAIGADPRIEWSGWRSPREVLEVVGEAAFLIMPSLGYETFGRTIVEAFARGTPVIASRRGAMAELVDDGRTGTLFRAGDAADLAAGIRRLLEDPAQLSRMRLEARKEYEAHYTAERGFRLLMDLYGRVVKPEPVTPVGQEATAEVGGTR